MHYFDLFKKYNFDLTDYIKEQNIKFDYYQPVSLEMPELCSLKNWKSVIDDEWLSNYIVPRDSRLDKIAYNLYENPNMWWVILLVNDINNPFDWILSDDEIMELANVLSLSENTYPLRVYQNLLFDYYNDRRNIKIIKPEYLTNFIQALKNKAK